MSVELCFHGAAGTVTRSCIEVAHDGRKLLVDCGLFQGSRSLEALNHGALPDTPKEIDGVPLTHAHLDHSGRLPALPKHGLEVGGRSLLLSGDIGRRAGEEASHLGPRGGFDVIVCESTYGDRDRPLMPDEERREQLAEIVEATMRRGGNLLIPAFALELSQAVLEDLVALFSSRRLKSTPVYVDSPLAERVTRVYRSYGRERPSPFDAIEVAFTSSVAQSRQLGRSAQERCCQCADCRKQRAGARADRTLRRLFGACRPQRLARLDRPSGDAHGHIVPGPWRRTGASSPRPGRRRTVQHCTAQQPGQRRYDCDRRQFGGHDREQHQHCGALHRGAPSFYAPQSPANLDRGQQVSR